MRETRRVLGLAVDADQPTLAARLELDDARAGGEDRVVAADTGARSGAKARSALAHDDLATAHALAGEHLHAEHLRVRIAAVAARPQSLLVRHLLLRLLRGALSRRRLSR